MSDQWGASAPQDGPWPPPAPPSYPGASAPSYPPQPPVPPAPAGPYPPPSESGLSWGVPQPGGFAPQSPSQDSYSQAEPYGQAPGYPTQDPYAAAAHAYLSSSGGYPQQAPYPQPPVYTQDPVYPQSAARAQAPIYQQDPAFSQTVPPYQQAPQYQQPAAPYAQAAPPPPPFPSQPSYAPQSSYRDPVQPEPYPQPPYPQAPGGPPIAVPATGASRPTNAFALTGALTCFVPVVGLVFSIIGLAKAKLLGGIGRPLAATGIALSLIFSAGEGVGGYYLLKAVDSTGADPGCVSAIGDYLTYSQRLGADAAAMGRTRYGTAQFTDSVRKYQADLEALIGKFDADAARADHGDVRSAITALVLDLRQIDTVMGDIATGNFGGAGALGDISTINGHLLDDYEHTQNICATYTNG